MHMLFPIVRLYVKFLGAILHFHSKRCATAPLVLICLLRSDIRKMQLLVETENAFQVRSKIVLILFRKKI